MFLRVSDVIGKALFIQLTDGLLVPGLALGAQHAATEAERVGMLLKRRVLSTTWAGTAATAATRQAGNCLLS